MLLKFVADVRQHSKTEMVVSRGFLQPLPFSGDAWIVISIDLVGGLPPS